MGWPVSHSRSPAIHNYWIQQYHLNGHYDHLPVEPSQLESAIRSLRAKGLAGCNITIPHKTEAIKWMDWVEPIAKKMGAINTIVAMPDGALHGFNNDGFGYLESLREVLPSWNANNGPIVVFGAGGASRAILLSLIHAGATEIRLLNRTHNKAHELSQEFGHPVTAYDWSERNQALEGAALVVNTTNQGMHGERELDIDLQELPTTALVSDIIYIPLETPLLKAARLRGNPTVNGLGMLLHQARPAFHAWFGVMPEVSPAMVKAIVNTF